MGTPDPWDRDRTSVPPAPDANDTGESALHRTIDVREVTTVYRFLRAVPPFSKLEEGRLRQVANAAHFRHAAPGVQLITQGEQGSTLMVLQTGEVEISLDRPPHDPIRLCTLRAPTFVGEMSLLDDQHRSATVTAVSECGFLELEREVLFKHLTPQVWSDLLREIATRVRRSDEIIVEAWSKLHNAAQHSALAAVSVDLATVRTLYERTERLANDMVQRAERSAAESARRTEDNADKAVRRSEQAAHDARSHAERQIDHLTRWQTVAGWAVTIVAGAIVAIGAFFGIERYEDVEELLAQVATNVRELDAITEDVQQRADKVNQLAADIESNVPLIATHHRTLDLRHAFDIVEHTRLNPTVQDIELAALYANRVRREIVERYIEGTKDTGRDRSPLVTIRAIETFLALSGRFENNRPRLETKDRDALLDALVGAVSRLADPNPEDGRHYDDGPLGDILQVRALHIANTITPVRHEGFVQGLLNVLGPRTPQHRPSTQPDRAGHELAALLLAHQGIDASVSPVRERLVAMMERSWNEPSTGCWSTARAAYALALLEWNSGRTKSEGWKHLRTRLTEARRDSTRDKRSSGYAAAVTLAQDPQRLRDLMRRFRASPKKVRKDIRFSLTCHEPRNRTEQIYVKYLSDSLTAAPGQAPARWSDASRAAWSKRISGLAVVDWVQPDHCASRSSFADRGDDGIGPQASDIGSAMLHR